MLIRFNVKNFLSFSERESGQSQEFSMIAGKVRNKASHVYDDGKIKLLKFAAVYGANAAGKSNLVKALNYMQTIVLNGLPKGHTESYCKIEECNKEKASYFELEIMIAGRYYAYGFEVILNQSRFVSEWLIELVSDGREKLVFSRDIENSKYEFGDIQKTPGLGEKLNVYAEDIQSDDSVLLLPMMNENKKTLYQRFETAAVFRDVYLWIRNSLDINYPNRPISDYSYMIKQENIKDVCKAISSFGTGITDFKLVPIALKQVMEVLPGKLQEVLASDIEKQIAGLRKDKQRKNVQIVIRSPREFFTINIDRDEEIKCETINFLHGNENVLFNISEESDGTVRILDLLSVLLSEGNKTYVIDELDRCLHPSLTYKFVETYLQLVKSKNIQLIVTTHESRLLDFDLLRRDEIWFVNKRKSGESDIYSLEEYNTRFDQKIDKAYLEGRYGGVPIFTSMFPVKEGV